MVGPKNQVFFAKNQYTTQRKPVYFENTGSASSSIGHDFSKCGSKIEVRKKCILQKMVSKIDIVK